MDGKKLKKMGDGIERREKIKRLFGREKIAVDKIGELEYNSAEEEITEIPGRLCPM